MESEQYTGQRKKLILRLRKLIDERAEVNNRIKVVRKEAYAWDTALIEGE